MGASLYFQRRLIILAALLPALSLALYGTPQDGLILFAIGLVGFGLIQGIWPASYIETLALSISISVFVPVIILTGWFAGFSASEAAPIAGPWLHLIIGFGWIYFTLGVVRAICELDRVEAGEKSVEAEYAIDLPFAEAADALLIKPGKQMANRQASPADEEGWFEVSFAVDGVNIEDFTDQTTEHSYSCKILEEEETPEMIRQVTQTVLTLNGKNRSSVIEQTFTSDGEGTRYVSREVHDLFSILAWMGYWLQDFGASHLKAEVDGYLGHDTSRSILKCQKSVMARIARFFVASGLSSKNKP